MENMKKGINYTKIALLLKIGVLGAFVILAGDMLMGCGVKDLSKAGLEAQLSPYLAISDTRMILAAVFGFSGVPLAVVGHYGIYKLIKPYSEKYARLYEIGNLGFLAFGGAGVHVSSVAAAFFYKYMNEASPNTAVESTVKFALYFLMPLYFVLLTGWFIMVVAHIRTVTKGLSPLPRWCWVFSMPIGTLLFSIIGICGNYEILNALMVGAFSLGNICSLLGHLIMINKVKKGKV